MELNRLQQRFEISLNRADNQLVSYLSNVQQQNLKVAEVHQLEGWLSELWQMWCRFCRTTVVASCTGCSTQAAGPIAAVHAGRGEVSYIAAKQRNGNAPPKHGHNSVLRLEPTWGHIARLIEVIQALSPANTNSLLGGFGTVPQIDEVRIIRNAAAHRNIQTYNEVLAISAGYKATGITHPVEALLWIDPPTGRTLVQARMDDMRIASRNVCA
ncbi:hypothetical protein [Acidovorax sp. LjRoot194]|uniref:hypothetical protein n=1 Tax=Acidovorax sp. LjRoot194 TaxID=3342280 RepID=UPI003ED11D93